MKLLFEAIKNEFFIVGHPETKECDITEDRISELEEAGDAWVKKLNIVSDKITRLQSSININFTLGMLNETATKEAQELEKVINQISDYFYDFVFLFDLYSEKMEKRECVLEILEELDC